MAKSLSCLGLQGSRWDLRALGDEDGLHQMLTKTKETDKKKNAREKKNLDI